jgi:hypothetical protein
MKKTSTLITIVLVPTLLGFLIFFGIRAYIASEQVDSAGKVFEIVHLIFLSYFSYALLIGTAAWTIMGGGVVIRRVIDRTRTQRRLINGNSPKPGSLLHPNPENFEQYCEEWCHYLGYPDAAKTRFRRDGGIDIRASNMIAQVKFQASPVGVRPIRELNGVRKDGQAVLFFALNGFTLEARKEAAQMGLTLIVVSPFEGVIRVLP